MEDFRKQSERSECKICLRSVLDRKLQNVAWSLDKANGNRDAGKYTIGVKDTLSNQHTDLNVKQERSASATKVYSTGTQSSHAFILLEQNPTSGFYKIQFEIQY